MILFASFRDCVSKWPKPTKKGIFNVLTGRILKSRTPTTSAKKLGKGTVGKLASTNDSIFKKITAGRVSHVTSKSSHQTPVTPRLRRRRSASWSSPLHDVIKTIDTLPPPPHSSLPTIGSSSQTFKRKLTPVPSSIVVNAEGSPIKRRKADTPKLNTTANTTQVKPEPSHLEDFPSAEHDVAAEIEQAGLEIDDKYPSHPKLTINDPECAGWTQSRVNVFNRLKFRGLDPIFHWSWKHDFPTFPAKFFVAHHHEADTFIGTSNGASDSDMATGEFCFISHTKVVPC